MKNSCFCCKKESNFFLLINKHLSLNKISFFSTVLKKIKSQLFIHLNYLKSKRNFHKSET